MFLFKGKEKHGRSFAKTVLLLASAFPLLGLVLRLYLPTISARAMTSLLATIIGGFILILTVAAGSRSGLVIMMIALAAAIALMPSDSIKRLHLPVISARPKLALSVLLLLLCVIVLFAADRTQSLQRVFASQDLVEDMRFRALPTVWSAVTAHFPAGAGVGSLADVFMLFDPLELLGYRYFNHAHSDVVEFMLEYGLAGAVYMLAALFLIAKRGLALVMVDQSSVWPRQANRLTSAQTGGIIVLLMIVGSLLDYPLRVPLMVTVMALAATLFFQDDIDGPTVRT